MSQLIKKGVHSTLQVSKSFGLWSAKVSNAYFSVAIHYSYNESITVYKLGHLFPNYNVLIGNFDNYCSNLIVSDD